MDFLESQSQNFIQAYSYKKKKKKHWKKEIKILIICVILFNGVLNVVYFFIWNSYLVLYPILYL